MDDSTGATTVSDHGEMFPHFAGDLLAERLEEQPFHLATLLAPRNFEQVRAMGRGRLVRRYFQAPLREKADLLYDMIGHDHEFGAVGSVMNEVERHRFVPARRAHLSYLDASVGVGSYCYLSAPSLVAVMLKVASNLEGVSTVMELGGGTGFHAECTRRVLRPDRLFSVELEQNLAATKTVARIGGLGPMRFLPPSAAPTYLRSVDYLYATVALTLNEFSELCSRLPDSAVVTLPRQLREPEFLTRQGQMSSPDVRSYSDYLTSSNWHQDVVLETREVGSGRQLQAHYGVRFMRAVVDGHIVRGSI